MTTPTRTLRTFGLICVAHAGIAAFSLVVVMPHAFATPPYQRSAAGGAPVTLEGILDALTDIYTRLGTSGVGSTGTDYSVNASPIPMSGFVLLKTIPANALRASVEVQNQSSGTIQIVRDDGSGGNQTTKLLTGINAGQQGGEWVSRTFKGRVRIYGAPDAQVGSSED